jgi:hypothetical protein
MRMLCSKWVRQCLVPCVFGLALVGVLAGNVLADMMIGVTVASAPTGWTVSGNNKSVQMPQGATSGNVVVNVYAIPNYSGTVLDGNDGVQQVTGSFVEQTVGGVHGDVTGVSYVTGWNGSTFNAGALQSLTGNGDIELGGTPGGGGNTSDYQTFANNNMIANTSASGILLGTITYGVKSATPGGSPTTINWVPDSDMFVSVWAEGGLGNSIAEGMGGVSVAGAAITVNAPIKTPEPSTLVLLGMGCIGLVIGWRRKNS